MNRASTTGVGSSVHTFGSIPINMHKKKMINKGETPTVSKLYLRVHQTKGSQWVDDKSKVAYKKYVQKLSEAQATQSTQATFDGATPSTPSEPSYDEQMKIWIDANGLTKQGRLCGFGPEGDIYTNSQIPCSIRNHDKVYTNTFATLFDENKRQKIELDSQKKVLDDVQAKLLEQAKRKKQTKKVQKYAKPTQDIQAQMFQWHSLMKTIIPSLPPPIPLIDSLSESEDGGEDDNDDDGGGGGGADE